MSGGTEVGRAFVVLELDQSDFDRGLSEARGKAKGFGDEFTTAAKTATVAMGLLGAGAALGLKSAIGAAADFSHSIAAVGAVSGATAEQLKQLSEKSMQIGQSTVYTNTEIAKSMEILAQNGISVTDILNGAAEATASLASAGGTSLVQAADTVSTAMVVWGASTQDMTRYINELAGAANVSRFGVEDMSQAIAMGGGVAASMGVSFDDFAASIAGTAAAFNSGSDAGTSFKTFLQRLAAPTDDAAKAMEQLGIHAFDATGKMLPMDQIVQQLHDSLGALSQADRAQAASMIFGTDAMRMAMSMAGMTKEQFDKLQGTLRDTSATDVANQRMTDFDKSMGNFEGSVETLEISIGSKLLPVLADLANWAAEALPKFMDWVGQLATDSGAVDLFTAALGALRDVAVGTVSFLTEHQDVAKALAAGMAAAAVEATALGIALLAITVLGNPFALLMIGTVAWGTALVLLAENWDDIRQGIDDGMKSLSDSVGESIGEIVGELGSLGARGVEALGDLSTALYESGQDFIDGFWEGVQDRVADFVDYIENLPENLVESIKSAAEGHSPWGITVPLGEDLIKGLELGVDNEAPNLEAHAVNAVGTAVAAAQSELARGLADTQAMLDQLRAGNAAISSGTFGDIPLDPGATIGPPGTKPLTPAEIASRASSARRQAAQDPNLQGPWLGWSQADIEAANKAARAAASGAATRSFSGGGGGGGGGSAKEAAQSAVDEFASAMQEALNHANFEQMWGDSGTKMMEAFEESLTNPKTAAKLPDLIAKMVADAKDAGVPNAVELGENLAAAVAEGLATGTAGPVEQALNAMGEAVKKAGAFTVESFTTAITTQAASEATQKAVGSAGQKLLDQFHKTVTEGGKKNVEAVASMVSGIVEALNDKAPEGQAAYLGTSLMTAMRKAIENDGPATEAALAAVLSQIKILMDGGAIDIRSGVELTAQSIKDLATYFHVDGKTVIDNIQVIIDSGLSKFAGSLKSLPQVAQESIAGTLKALQDGTISIQRAIIDIAEALGVTLRTEAVNAASGGGTTGPNGKPINPIQNPNGVPGATAAETAQQILGFDPFAHGTGTVGGTVTDPAGHVLTEGEILNLIINGGLQRALLLRGYTAHPGAMSDPSRSPIPRDPVTGQPIVGPENPPRYALGTDWVPEDGLAFLHRGEAVLTAQENAAGRNTTFAPTINVTIQGNADGPVVKRAIQEAIEEWKANELGYGAKLAGVKL